MRKTLALLTIAALLFSAAAGLSIYGPVQASTEVAGIITSDTTWTKANSPYVFASYVAVNKGTTLNIEPGATVDMGLYTLQVNGTLNAIGTATDKITFKSGDRNVYYPDNIDLQRPEAKITVQNAIFKTTSILSYVGEVKISNCTFEKGAEAYGAGVLGWNSTTIADSYIEGEVTLKGNSSLTGSRLLNGLEVGDAFTITGNDITNTQKICINLFHGKGILSDNKIHGGTTAGINLENAQATIQRNSITNNQIGILIWKDVASTIQNNTIANNHVGISDPTPSQAIIYNNINDNKLNMALGYQNIAAPNNWWGTTDATAISQTIQDYQDDFHLGKADFEPFLSAPNPQAPPISQPELESFPWVPVAAAVIAAAALACIVLFVYFRKRRSEVKQT